MNPPFGGRRRHRCPIINITSLIDVMFLLVIFFSVSSTFDEPTGVDIALPVAGTASEQADMPNEIFVQENGEVRLDPDSSPITLATLGEHLAALLQEQPGATITVSADRGVDYQQVLSVIDLARNLGVAELILPAHVPDTKAPGD